MQKPTKYRRAFEFRIVKADRPSLIRGIEAFLRLSVPEYAEVLEDYLEIGKKRRNNRTALAKLQLHLLDELASTELSVSHSRKKAEAMKSQPAATPPGQQEPPNKDLEQIDREIFFHRAHANCLRSIGDSLAWRAVGYDRAVLRALCQNPVKQRVIAEGAQQELVQWSHAFDPGTGLAILNSITNCLSLGDVTVVKNDESIEIVEVKAGKGKSRRLTRQKQKMQEVVNLLNFGKGELEYPQVEILRTEVFPENGLEDLSAALDEAARKGWAARRLSNFLFVECHDYRMVKDFDEMRRLAREARRTHVADWTSRHDRVLPMATLNSMEFTPNRAPFSIFPFRTEVRVGLLTGGMDYTSFLNISAIEREFERLGWQVEKKPEDLLAERGDLATGYWTVAKGGLHSTIGPAEISRMAYETLRPRVIVQVLEEALQMGQGATLPHTFTVYSREHEIWD